MSHAPAWCLHAGAADIVVVVAPVASGKLRRRGLSRRSMDPVRRQQAAMKTSPPSNFAIIRSAKAGAVRRGADHMGTEPVRTEGGEITHAAAQRGAGSGTMTTGSEVAALAVLLDSARARE